MISYHFDREEKIPSPALIYYSDQIRENVAKAIEIAGGAERMWPHIKTHKMSRIVKMQLEMGISRFKCATYVEACMAAECSAKHILWAYPILGPNVEKFLSLHAQFPDCTFYALEDDPDALRVLSDAAQAKGMQVNVLADVNVGMNRTGIAPERLPELYRMAAEMPGVQLRGLHCYDGHVHDSDFAERQAHADRSVNGALKIREALLADGFDAQILILGGTPSFPCHAGTKDAFLSPGTMFVSDAGYQKSFPDIGVIPAATVLTRVISHPADGLFTLDTGYKAISADQNPRGTLVDYADMCEPVMSSEEHWVFKMKPEYADRRPAVGEVLFVIPTHICPTTCMYDAAYVCSGGKLTDIWTVDARERVGATCLSEVLQ